eukprot:g5166.t1
MYPAVLTALDDINANTAVLPGTTLAVKRYDHQCNPGLGVRGLIDVLQDTTARPLLGILDGGCSSVAKSVTDIGRFYNLVSLSGVAATPLLSDKGQYPFFLRTTGSFEGYVAAMVGILQHYKWTKVATITENQGLYSIPMASFEVEAARLGIDIMHAATLSQFESAAPGVRAVSATFGAKIIVVQCGPFVMRKLFCEALRQGAVGPDTVWVVPGWFSAGFWRPVPGDPYNCTEAEMRNATQGYLAMEFSALAPDDHRVVSTNEFPSAVNTRIQERAQSLGVQTIEFGFSSYDAVVAWALAVHDLIHGQGMTFDELGRDGTGQAAVRDALYRTDFYGVSGRVTVDQLTGDRRGQHLRIENQVDGVEVLVGLCAPDSTMTMDPATPVVWHGSPSANGVYTDTGDAFAPTGRGATDDGPRVDSVIPSVISPKGGAIELHGRNFRPGRITIDVGKEQCEQVVFLFVSNDDRLRWVSGITFNIPLEFFGGSTVPAAAQTINFPASIVIGATIPTDYGPSGAYADATRDLTLAFDSAAEAVNRAKIFPGQTQLQIQILHLE